MMMFASAPSLKPCRPRALFATASHAEGGARDRPKRGLKALQRPKTGYFADVDPKAEVYPVKKTNNASLTDKKDRWTPEFIWNIDWMGQADSNGEPPQQGSSPEAVAEPARPAARGYLSIAGRQSLDSLDRDLSQELIIQKKQRLDGAAEAGLAAQMRPAAKSQPVPAFRNETRAWQRTSRFAERASLAADASRVRNGEAAAEAARLEQEAYDTMKAAGLVWTLGLSGICLAGTAFVHGSSSAASYAVGAVAGLLYLRALYRTVDGMSPSGSGMAGSMLSQQRLLIPAILILGFNRYETLAAPATGQHLSLLALVGGFFTYKLALVGQQGAELLAKLAKPGDAQ
ncbi:hypothetical protein ACKKBG_A01720 [Auxenochlorella protothecoides x Auxenochlorella symbiontica]|uniref:CGL160/ATPI domain-containing protein n=1 Tax=Auxenochlorella protothecoides TaxID=3075 RepID=A0A1D2A7A3_AUXPR